MCLSARSTRSCSWPLARRTRGDPNADAIVVEDIGKTYPDGSEAVRGVPFGVAGGECYLLIFLRLGLAAARADREARDARDRRRQPRRAGAPSHARADALRLGLARPRHRARGDLTLGAIGIPLTVGNYRSVYR